jgi:hypothetical protein
MTAVWSPGGRISQRLCIWHFLFTRIVATDEYDGCLVRVLQKESPCLTTMERADVTEQHQSEGSGWQSPLPLPNTQYQRQRTGEVAQL